MSYAPTTRLSLLVRLQDARDRDAWGLFVRLYAPLVYQYGRRNGLQDADAADLTQEVLRAAAAGADRLEQVQRNGSFRSWLFTVAHHKLYDLRARQRRNAVSDTPIPLEELPDRAEEADWDREYRRRVFTWAAEQVRPTCSDTAWQAFWQTAVEGKSGQEVACALHLTVAAVYLAKSRVMARLKKQVELWEAS